jgi:hypothetical protein
MEDGGRFHEKEAAPGDHPAAQADLKPDPPRGKQGGQACPWVKSTVNTCSCRRKELTVSWTCVYATDPPAASL